MRKIGNSDFSTIESPGQVLVSLNELEPNSPGQVVDLFTNISTSPS